MDRIERLIKTGGGEIVCGGNINKETRYIAPTMILEPDMQSELMKDEIFGPVLPVYPYSDFTEAINFINDKDKPLTVHYFGERGSNNERRLANETTSGHFNTNECLVQFMSNYQGFGGVGKSGCGRHGGKEGFKNFSNRKGMIMKKPAPKFMLEGNIPPWTQEKKDGALKMIPGALATNQEHLSSFCSGFLMVILLSIQAYFFYVYGMANPDSGYCFANNAGVVTATRAETKTMEGEFFAVSNLFGLWFMCGFIITSSALLYYIFTFINFKCCGNANLMTELVKAIGYFAVLGTLVWLVLGTMLRWSVPGKACAGDSVANDGQAPY